MLGVCFRAAIAKLRLQAAETTLKLQRGGLLTTQMSFAPTTTPIHTTAGAQVVTFASGARASECTYEQVKASETRRGVRQKFSVSLVRSTTVIQLNHSPTSVVPSAVN